MRALQRLGVTITQPRASARGRWLGVENAWATYQEQQVLGADTYDTEESWDAQFLVRADYALAPWRGENYGTQRVNADEPTFEPAIGVAQNGYSPAAFDGTADILRTSVPVETLLGGGSTLTCLAVVKVNSAPAPTSFGFESPCVFVTESSATIGLCVSSSGVAFGVYDSIAGWLQTAWVPLTAGAYNVVQAEADGSNLRIRVNGGAWSASVAYTAIAADPTNVLVIGADYTGATNYLDGDVLEIGFGTRVCDATEHAAQNTYAVTRYGLASKRCLVLLDGALRELPTSAPYGLRVILSGGALVTSVAGGKSLVVDAGALREATAGEVVLVPP